MEKATEDRRTIKECLLVLVLLLPGVSVSAETLAHEYTVTLDDTMSRLLIEARFRAPITGVSARSRNARNYILDARKCGDDTRLPIRGRRMSLPADGIRCLNYAVDLTRAASEYRYAGKLTDQQLVASPSYWLWRPELHNETSIRIDFRLPDGVQVSVPWQPTDNSGHRFLLGRSPENASSPAVFGHFDYRQIEVPGSTLRVAILKGEGSMDNNAIADWITATATDVSLAYGRFPSPSPQVVVVPVRGGRSAVSFGQVIRDGGETVELAIDPDEPVGEFLADWKATHEFSHLLLPYITRNHRWISEGFAQYYQNVLLAKSGAYDETYAWQKIHDGLQRGRQSSPDLSPNQAAKAGARSAGMKVYWSGAALALIADVTLRERSGGEEGLSDVLGRFQACCLPSPLIWSGPEFFSHLDELISEPLFMPLYTKHADSPGFPDTIELLHRLGVSVAGGKATLDQDAELKLLRDEITGADRAAAKWRYSLTAN